MASILSAESPSPARRSSGASAGIKAYWREFLLRILDPYRPELHYMRGPGPAWRAKHGEAAAFRLTPSQDL